MSFPEFSSRCFSKSKFEQSGIDTSKPVEVSFKTDSGVQTKKYEFIHVEKEPTPERPFVSYEINKEKDVGVFKLDRCLCDDKYCNTVDNFLADVASQNIKNIVVDLRLNLGGSDRAYIYFVKYLKNLQGYIKNKTCERTSRG